MEYRRRSNPYRVEHYQRQWDLSLGTGGTLILSNANNTYSGGTTVSAGTLKAGVANALPAGTTLTVYGSGAVFDLNGYNVQVANLSDNGVSTGTVTNSGGAAALTINNSGNNTFSATISGTNLSLVKTGSGTLTLSGNNTYGGGTTISGGTVTVGSSTALGTGAATLNGGTLLIGGSKTAGLLGKYFAAGAPSNGHNWNDGDANWLNLTTVNNFYNAQTPTASRQTGNQALGNGYSGFDFTTDYTTVNWSNNGAFNSNASNFTVIFTGKFNAPTAGSYTFSTTSDDGSELWIDGSLVVNNNYGQAAQKRTGTTALSVGAHDIEVVFDQGGGGWGMGATVTPPGGSEITIPWSTDSGTAGLYVGSAPSAFTNAVNVTANSTIDLVWPPR